MQQDQGENKAKRVRRSNIGDRRFLSTPAGGNRSWGQHRNWCGALEGSECLPAKRTGSIAYAVSSSPDSPDRGRCSPVAGGLFYPHASHHQVDRERGRRHRRSGMAPECVWSSSLDLQDSRPVSKWTHIGHGGEGDRAVSREVTPLSRHLDAHAAPCTTAIPDPTGHAYNAPIT